MAFRTPRGGPGGHFGGLRGSFGPPIDPLGGYMGSILPERKILYWLTPLGFRFCDGFPGVLTKIDEKVEIGNFHVRFVLEVPYSEFNSHFKCKLAIFASNLHLKRSFLESRDPKTTPKWPLFTPPDPPSGPPLRTPPGDTFNRHFKWKASFQWKKRPYSGLENSNSAFFDKNRNGSILTGISNVTFPNEGAFPIIQI